MLKPGKDITESSSEKVQQAIPSQATSGAYEGIWVGGWLNLQQKKLCPPPLKNPFFEKILIPFLTMFR